MLFTDEPRFYSDREAIAVNDDSLLIGRAPTEEHIGPGSYFTAKNDAKRGNWAPRSPRPTSSTFRSKDVNHSTTTGIIHDDLYVHSGSRVDLPGPGYYSPQERKSSRGFSMNTSAEMQKIRKNISLASDPMLSPKSPRFTPLNATMRDDVLCYSTSHRDEFVSGGPGYYYKNECGLLKKSFNVRAGRKQPLKSPEKRVAGGSPRNSYNGTANFRSSSFPMSPIQKTNSAYVTPVHH